MSFKSGSTGKLYIANTNLTSATGASYVGKVRDWNISFTQSPIDTTTLNQTDRTLTQGIRSFNGGGTVLYYNESNSNFQLLTKNMIATSTTDPTARDAGKATEPSMVRLELECGDETISVYAYMTNFAITCATGEVLSASFQFEGTSAVKTFEFSNG